MGLNFYIPAWTIQRQRDNTSMAGAGMNRIFFGRGKFDDYCAYCSYIDQYGQELCAMPLDTYYFDLLYQLGSVYGYWRVYQDVKHVYEQCRSKIDPILIDRIRFIAVRYGQDGALMHDCLLHLYYGMVAEENKANTKIGRLIKMNGVHSLLIDQRGVDVSANECRNMGWREIEAEANVRGIYRDFV